MDSDKQEQFNRFMSRLAEDPVLRSNTTGSRYTLEEILQEARYPLKQEFRYDYGQQKHVPVEASHVIDVALLLTLLFQEKGLNCTSEDLMNHVLNGGSVEQFMQQAYGSKDLQ
ncbi:hypothetical protein [Paenibacillus ihuae]|uniref:hypothetical protein n=1 Tax=Paenibacillus ihuae TaxID=1232431 RepID=UPI0006D59236|nr:hypothetical protein [Paenibacillus ihuae]